jgi:hypothetical protein
MADADYAILITRGSDFNSLRTQAAHHSVLVLTPLFVMDCDAQGQFLETPEYEMSPIEASPNKPRRRPRKSGSEGAGTADVSEKKKQAKSNPYTDQEKEFFSQYVRRLLKKMPDMSSLELAKHLNNKVSCLFCWYF